MADNIVATFYADGVLFGMGGTLVDSTAATEAAWSKFAKELGKDPARIIAATRDKRVSECLLKLKPHIKPHRLDAEVKAFEECVLFFADAYHKYDSSFVVSPFSSGTSTPSLSFSPSSVASSSPPSLPSSSRMPSRTTSFTGTVASDYFYNSQRPILTRGASSSSYIAVPEECIKRSSVKGKDRRLDSVDEMDITEDWKSTIQDHQLSSWQMDAVSVDRSIHVLPGVRKLLHAIPRDRYAIATSRSRSYAYGCLALAGLIAPDILVTTDDKRVKTCKPSPEPFLLAAQDLGFDTECCVVFEDSPAGIRAGVASGATVIGVCTTHSRSEIAECGAHLVVDSLEQVHVVVENYHLKFVIEQHV